MEKICLFSAKFFSLVEMSRSMTAHFHWSMLKGSSVGNAFMAASKCLAFVCTSKPCSSPMLKSGACKTSQTNRVTSKFNLWWLPVVIHCIRCHIDILAQGQGGACACGLSGWLDNRDEDRADKSSGRMKESGLWVGWWWYFHAIWNLLNAIWKLSKMCKMTCQTEKEGAAEVARTAGSGRMSWYLASSLCIQGACGSWEDKGKESMAWLGEGLDTGSLEECRTSLWAIVSSEGWGRGLISTFEFISPGCYQFKVRWAAICTIRHFLTTLKLLACGSGIHSVVPNLSRHWACSAW